MLDEASLNPKQRLRILKRRQSRSRGSPSVPRVPRRGYTHHSRHALAVSRPRDPTGRFVTPGSTAVRKPTSTSTSSSTSAACLPSVAAADHPLLCPDGSATPIPDDLPRPLSNFLPGCGGADSAPSYEESVLMEISMDGRTSPTSHAVSAEVSESHSTCTTAPCSPTPQAPIHTTDNALTIDTPIQPLHSLALHCHGSEGQGDTEEISPLLEPIEHLEAVSSPSPPSAAPTNGLLVSSCVYSAYSPIPNPVRLIETDSPKPLF
eukprot:Rmarinus@m.14446